MVTYSLALIAMIDAFTPKKCIYMKDIKLNSFTLDALELSVPWYEFPYNDETVSATLSNG